MAPPALAERRSEYGEIREKKRKKKKKRTSLAAFPPLPPAGADETSLARAYSTLLYSTYARHHPSSFDLTYINLPYPTLHMYYYIYLLCTLPQLGPRRATTAAVVAVAAAAAAVQ